MIVSYKLWNYHSLQSRMILFETYLDRTSIYQNANLSEIWNKDGKLHIQGFSNIFKINNTLILKSRNIDCKKFYTICQT